MWCLDASESRRIQLCIHLAQAFSVFLGYLIGSASFTVVLTPDTRVPAATPAPGRSPRPCCAPLTEDHRASPCGVL
jgi:hypothetical protein